MLKLNEFILLKAIFNEQLHNAVLSKDERLIKEIVFNQYTFEVENGFISNVNAEIDAEKLYKDHVYQLEHDDFKWAY